MSEADRAQIEAMLASAVEDTEISGQVGLRNVRQRLRLVNINGRYLLKDRIFGFDLVEDGEQITKGGLGAAVAGGIVGSLAPKLIGRSTGAIVGASIGKRKTTNSCTS